jgi:hypothetical protein
MQFGRNGKDYRLIHDSDSYARGVLGSPFESQWLNDADVRKQLSLPETPFEGIKHMPDDDAENIYKMHSLVVQAKK